MPDDKIVVRLTQRPREHLAANSSDALVLPVGLVLKDARYGVSDESASDLIGE